METLRQTMTSCRISDIVNGNFIKKEGLDPSYILTELGQKISRVKLVGTVVENFMSEGENYSSITLDDDTDSIRVKAFGDDVKKFDNLNDGDQVLVIGKVKEYSDENYVLPEIMKKVVPDYELLHKLEILKEILQKKRIVETVKKEKDKFADFEELKKFILKKHKFDKKDVENTIEFFSEKEETKEKDYKPLILENIDKMDIGEGIEIKSLLEKIKIPENIFSEAMDELLSEGICFEPKPGVIKKV